MNAVVEKLFKKEFEEKEQKGRQEGRQEGALETLSSLVKDGILTLADAANRAGLSVSDFKAKTTII